MPWLHRRHDHAQQQYRESGSHANKLAGQTAHRAETWVLPFAEFTAQRSSDFFFYFANTEVRSRQGFNENAGCAWQIWGSERL